MEHRRISGKSHWYHETQSSARLAQALPLVPEAATVNDPFLLDLTLPDEFTKLADFITPSRKLYALLFPQRVAVSRLRTFSAYDRLSTALTVAQVFGVQRLCNHYAARLAPLPGPDSSRESNFRLAQITQYARQLAASPSVINERARQQLEDVGLTLYDLVLINQIIGFIAFQARIVAILQALLGQPVRPIPGMDTQQEAEAQRFIATDIIWQAGINGVDLHIANAQQMESLAHWQPLPELRLLAPLLAHEHLLLDELGEIITGLAQTSPDAQQSNFVALYTARINGSESCFALYQARFYDDTALLKAMREGGRALSHLLANRSKDQAVVQAVQLLTCAPDRFGAPQLSLLLDQGFSRQSMFSLLTVCALSGWLNRLKIALGHTV
ncbi:CMD domain-containing protein [Salmonella enterica]